MKNKNITNVIKKPSTHIAGGEAGGSCSATGSGSLKDKNIMISGSGGGKQIL